MISKLVTCISVLTIAYDFLQPTMPAAGKKAPRVGNLGHVTRIANKITQLGNIDNRIQTHIQVCNHFRKVW